MVERILIETEHVIQYRDPDDGWEDEYTISHAYLNATHDTAESFYESWIHNQMGEYRLVKRVTEKRIVDTIVKENKN